MAAGFLLALREGLEAALIIGVAMSVLRRARLPQLERLVWLGMSAAAAVSLLVGLALTLAGARLEGSAEQAFDGVTMLLAAGLLTWMVFWLRSQGGRAQRGLEADVQRVAGGGQSWALFWLAFLAILREGIELSLFLVAAGLQSGTATTLVGALAGLATAAAVGWAIFTTTLRMNVRRFFALTGGLVVLFAAGLVGHGVRELVEAGWLPGLVDPVWSTSRWLPEQSLLGSILTTLFGYHADPSLSEIIAYCGYLIAVLAASLRLAAVPRRTVER